MSGTNATAGGPENPHSILSRIMKNFFPPNKPNEYVVYSSKDDVSKQISLASCTKIPNAVSKVSIVPARAHSLQTIGSNRANVRRASATPTFGSKHVVVQRPIALTAKPTQMSPRRISNNSFNYEKYRNYKQMAEQASRDRKVFTIVGVANPIRLALLRRGWLERFWETTRPDLQKLSHHSLLQNSKPNNDYEAAAISKLLMPYHSNFIWFPRQMRMNRFDEVVPFKSRINRAREFDFTLKDGLCNISKCSHWHNIIGRSELSCPRTYRLFVQDELNDFMCDYRFTGCTSLLMYLMDGQDPDGETNRRFSSTGTVSLDCIRFAIRRIRERIRMHNHEDVDNFQPERLESSHWKVYFADYHATARQGALFMDSKERVDLMATCKNLMVTVRANWPNVLIDGYRNIWIMKPAAQNRGIGITLMENNLTMLDLNNRYRGNRYVVQKYLERPLLIYNTKFDMRQYFLLMGRGNNVQVWMYKIGYLKLSGQEFSLVNYHESVHLTNHFVQKNYTNARQRNPKLPACNMWSTEEFKTYLTGIDKPNVWKDKIYPGMRRSIVAAVRACYDENFTPEPNCFELFGADFMVTENYDVQLLEINATPDMYASTKVTGTICPQCLEDTIKVVVDRARNWSAPTGQFEYIYEMSLLRSPPHVNLTVTGSAKALQRSYGTPSRHRAAAIPPKQQSSPRIQNSPKVQHSKTPSTPSKATSVALRPSVRVERTKTRPATYPSTQVVSSKVSPRVELERKASYIKNNLSSGGKRVESVRPATPPPKTRVANVDAPKYSANATLRARSGGSTHIPKPNQPPPLTIMPARRYIVAPAAPPINKEVIRLMELNQTIEQLLRSRQVIVQVAH